VIIEGVMYVSTAWSNVRAFDAKTAKPLCFYDAKVPRRLGVRGCCDVVNRGVAAWKGKIFVDTFGGRLVALDAKTGQSVWRVMTVDLDKRYTKHNGAAGRGVTGSEYGVRGYTSAYGVETGALAWRFYTVPGDPSKGFENEAMEMAAQHYRSDSPGDNLFLSSIIALNADAGACVWHYQAIPGEEWISLDSPGIRHGALRPGYKLGAPALQHQHTTYIES
jgi:glucose dehydrogenase